MRFRAWTCFAPLFLCGCADILGLGGYGTLAEGAACDPDVVGSGWKCAAGLSCTGGFCTAPDCTPGEVQACVYGGAVGTENKGICRAGVRICNEDSVFLPCMGEVQPEDAETCGNGIDEDCDGVPDGDCPCTPGMVQSCHVGPPGTEGVGICTGGVQTCDASGAGFGPCVGSVGPSAEDCGTPFDEDCDGVANGNCPCMPGATQACYDGPASAMGQGPCVARTQTCDPSGLTWGACAGSVVPVPETCLTTEDDDCDGQTNEEGEACVCLPNQVGACYTGPMGTEGVGICAAGMGTCNGDGTGVIGGSCTGEVTPGVEDCDATGDEDCDGSACSEADWVVSFPGSITEVHVATAPNGDVVVLGGFLGNLQLGAFNLISAGFDYFLARFDSTGAVLWAKNIGGTPLIFPVGTPEGPGVAVGENGNIVVGVELAANDVVDFGGGPITNTLNKPIVVAKLDPDGVQLWTREFGGGNGQTNFSDLAIAPSGEILVVGNFDATVAFGNGTPVLMTMGGTDAFVAKLDPSGDALWSKRFGDASYQYISAVTVDAGENIIFGGSNSGSFSIGGPSPITAPNFVGKLAPAGNYGGQLAITGALPNAILADVTGNVWVAATVDVGPADMGGGALPTFGGRDIAVAKYNAFLAHQVSMTYGGPNFDWRVKLALGDSGPFLSAGSQGGVDFGGGPLMSSSPPYDSVFAAMDSALVHRWSRIIAGTGDRTAVGVHASGKVVFVTSGGPDPITVGGITVPPGLVVAQLSP